MPSIRRTLPLLFLLLRTASLGQFGPLLNPRQAPQAKSQEELDLYLEIYTHQDAGFRVDAVNRFAALYPRSELMGFVWQYQMLAYQERNDYEGVLRAGERALALMPRNLNTLTTLATAIPNGVATRADGPALLQRAENYARQALDELGSFRVPQEMPLAEWEAQRGAIESRCHEALGHIALKRGDAAAAVRELETAVGGEATPNGRQLLRLSSAYLLAGRRPEAERAAQRAVELSDGELRQIALRQLESIQNRKAP